MKAQYNSVLYRLGGYDLKAVLNDHPQVGREHVSRGGVCTVDKVRDTRYVTGTVFMAICELCCGGRVNSGVLVSTARILWFVDRCLPNSVSR
jgi:hypothetical protein